MTASSSITNLQQELEFTPFGNDQLGRKAVAKYLTDYLTGKFFVSTSITRNSSFVLNINSQWGVGKTYFLTEWAKQLRQDGHVVIVFDAWKNDFTAEPLLGFMAEIELQLRSQLSTKAVVEKSVTNLVKKSKGLIKVAAPTVGLALLKALVGLDLRNINLEDIADGIAADEVSEKLSEKIKDKLYEDTKNIKCAIADFKEGLAETIRLVQGKEGKKLPLFIFIDELDRCRPTFSIRLLEDIKHIFGVEGIYFVIATDSKQLAHSIKAVYGHDFESQTYLRRFFDQEYSLPDPDRFAYANYLFSQFGLREEKRFFTGLADRCHPPHEKSARLFAAFADFFKLTLRDQEQACAVLDAIRLTSSNELHLAHLLFCIMLRLTNPEAFEALRLETPIFSEFFKRIVNRVDRKVEIQDLVFKDANIFGNASGPEPMFLTELITLYVDLRITNNKDMQDLSERSPQLIKRTIYERFVGSAKERNEVVKYPDLVHSAEGLIHLTRT